MNIFLIVQTIHIILQTRGLDSGLPYTDGERCDYCAGALARLTLLNSQFRVNYLYMKLRDPLDPTPRKLS